jgi:hypothetical protein
MTKYSDDGMFHTFASILAEDNRLPDAYNVLMAGVSLTPLNQFNV